MQIGVNYPERLQGAGSSLLDNTRDAIVNCFNTLGRVVSTELERALTAINAWSNVEHNSDGTHKSLWATFTPVRSAVTGTYSGGTARNIRFNKRGTTVSVQFVVDAASNSAATASVSFLLPNNMLPTQPSYNPCAIYETGGIVFTTGIMSVAAGSGKVFIERGDGANIGINVATLYIRGQLQFEV